MPNEQDQQVTVRRLPDGDAHEAVMCSLNGQLLRIDLPPAPADLSLRAGDLVEVNCPRTLYLGEVRSFQGETMIVGVEHALDRETLEQIRQIWHGPVAR